MVTLVAGYVRKQEEREGIILSQKESRSQIPVWDTEFQYKFIVIQIYLYKIFKQQTLLMVG